MQVNGVGVVSPAPVAVVARPEGERRPRQAAHPFHRQLRRRLTDTVVYHFTRST